MRFEALLERHERGELSQMEAAELLGMSERTFRRHRDRFREEGEEGLRDRRLGKPSSRRAAVAEIERMLGLYRDEYADFTMKHFHEQLGKRHNYKLGYTVTRLALKAAGLVRPAPRRSAHRKKRPRRPMPGMMLHQDGSRFAWLPGDGRQYDLIVTLDDATNEMGSGRSARSTSRRSTTGTITARPAMKCSRARRARPPRGALCGPKTSASPGSM
jgi:transposase